MTQTFVNPYSGQAEDTCSVAFASQAHVASVHDQQTEAQFNKSKLLGEYGVIKAKAAKGDIANGTKVLAFDGAMIKGYVYVKGKKLFVRRYAVKDGKLKSDIPLDDNTADAYFGTEGFKWSIPQSVLPKQDQADTIHTLTGWDPDQFINTASYWAAVTKAKKAGKLEPGTVVAVNPDYQVRLVYKGDNGKQTYELQGANDAGDWNHVDYAEYPQQATNTFDDGWYTPADTVTTAPPHAAPSQAKPLTQADGKKIQQDDTLQEGDLLAVANSSSGATKYRIVLGKKDADEPFLVLAKGPSDADFKQIDKGDWFPDLIDDGNKWYKPTKDPAPVAAPTPKPAVSQGSTSTGSMSDEDVATMFVQLKDQLASAKGINIKGSNPELDAEVHKAIGDAIGYTAIEVKGKIDAYKASGKKLSALKKKVLKKGPQPAAKPKPADPNPTPMPNAVPTQATEDVFDDILDGVSPLIDKSLYSNEDIAGAYVIAKDKIVADSGGKWTLYTKNDEMDALIYKEVQDKTGHTQAEAKHAIAVYLSDPSNKLSKLKKSLIKQGKLKPEADTLKKKKTPAEVQADIDNNAASGYTPAGNTSNPAAPIPSGVFEPRGKPKTDDLSFTGQEVGTHHAQIWTDKDGNQWLFKPQEQFLNDIDVATSKLAKKLGHPAADTYQVTLNGKTGSLQRMFPGGDAFPNGLDPETAPTAHILAVQMEHVLDWLMANHDNHDKNYVLDEQGNLVGIDKGQALKFLGMDELSWTFVPNQFEPAPNKLYKAFAEGKNVALNDPGQGALKDFIDKVKAMDDQELKDLFRPYAEAAKAKGSLATGQPHWKPGALKPKTLPVNDVEAFLDAIVKRKNNLDKDFAELYGKAKAERDKKITPAQDANSVQNQPGDVSHIPENVKETFKAQVGSLLSSDSPEQIYTKLENSIDYFKGGIFKGLPQEKLSQMSILQAVRIMDELKAKKANVPNGHLYEKKLVTWLTSPAGKAFFQGQKDKEEAKKKVQELKDKQPDLPPDSKAFSNIEMDEVRKWQEAQKDWTPDQEGSLKHYTSNQGFTEMNGNLRGNTFYMKPTVQKHVQNARDGMRPLDRPIVAHRGTTAVSFGLADNGSENDLLYGLVGTLHKQVGFSSASFGAKAGFGSKPVIIHFECPPGTPAAFVRDISYYKTSQENEILLDHALEVRVLKVWEDSSGWSTQYHVQVRVESWEGKA